jgi:hypothetical protein
LHARTLSPAPAQAPPPCVDLVAHFTVTVAGQSFIVLDSSNAADTCPCDSSPYAAQFADMRPAPGSWFLTLFACKLGPGEVACD